MLGDARPLPLAFENSPFAFSNDGSSGDFGEEENHPPGKNFADDVDSSLARPLLGVTVSTCAGTLVSTRLSSWRGSNRERPDLASSQ